MLIFDGAMDNIPLFDLLLLGILVIGLPLLSYLDRRRPQPGDVHSDAAYQARCRKLAVDMLLLWGLVAAIMLFGTYGAGMLADLGLSLPSGWTLWVIIAWAAALLLALLQAIGTTRVGDKDKQRALDMLAAEPGIAAITPVARRDWPWWVALSLTAGITEEIIYRGYLMHLASGYMGLWAAAGASWLLFVVAHAYQNVRGLIGVAAMGALLTICAVLAESIWPSIILHAVVDLCSGYIILQSRMQPPEAEHHLQQDAISQASP